MLTAVSRKSFFSVVIMLMASVLVLTAVTVSAVAVRKTFQQEVDGYTGTRDTWLQVRYGRENWNAGGHPALRTHGHAHGDSGDESRRRDSLIRFDDLFGPGTPAGSLAADDIIKATLTMTVYRANNINDLSVYAMITPWEAGDKDNAPAGDGESTAAHRFHRVDGNYTPADYWGVAGTPVEFPTMDDAYGELHQSDYLDAAGPFDYMGNGVFGEDGWPVDLDVTEAVKGWLNGTIAKHGFWLRSHGSWWSSYDMYSSSFTGKPEWRPRLTIEYFPPSVTNPIELQPGYQFISSNLMLLEVDLQTSIFAGLIERGSLDFVRDSTGRTMQRIAGQWLNPIGEWTSTEGYLMHMNQADILQLEGEELDPRTPIELVPGYQFVAYLPSYQLTAAEAFASLKDNGLVSVRDSEGGTLRQAGGQWVDDLGLMKAGRGYLVRMSEPATLVYPAAKSLPLVVDGEARAVVVTADNPTPVASLAVAELVEHVRSSTGVELATYPESRAAEAAGRTRIFVGVTETAVQAGLDFDRLASDVFILRTAGGDLFIGGRENQEVFSRNSGYNGTLYGVYEFIDRFLGVRWLWPGELGTYIPQHDTVRLPSLDETVEMALEWRDIRYSRLTAQIPEYDPRVERLAFSPAGLENYHEAVLDYLRRHRMGRSTPRPWVTHHRLWQQQGEKYPEFFKLNQAGERVGPTLCASNPDLHRFLVEEYSRTSLNDIMIGEADVRTYCHCEDCLAWDEPQPEDWPHHITSNRYARLAAAVRDLVRQREPDNDETLVNMFIYMDYTYAPTIDIDLQGVFASFCPWFSGFNPYYPKPEDEHHFFMETWRGWHETGIQLYYRPNSLLSGYVMPHLSTWQAGEMLQFTAEHGSRGNDLCSLHGQWAVMGPMYYLHMRLSSDPFRDIAAVRYEYFEAFGPAASRVEEYFDYWETYSADQAPRGGVHWADPFRSLPPHQIYPPASFEPARDLLDEAMRLALGADRDEYARRIEFLQAGLEHARLAADFTSRLDSRGGVPGQKEQFDAAREALLRLIDFRREHEHLFICDFVSAAAFPENRGFGDAIDQLLEGEFSGE